VVEPVPVIASATTDQGQVIANGEAITDPHVTFAGTAEDNSTVTIFDGNGNVVGAATADSSGDWTYDDTSVTLPTGDNSFSATSVDSTGVTENSTTDFGFTVRPVGGGAPPAEMTVASLTLASSASFLEDIDGAAPGAGGYDQTIVQAGGTVSLGGATLVLSSDDSFAPTLGDVYTIIDNQTAGAVTGAFAGLAQGSLFAFDGALMQISYAGGDGDDVTLTDVASFTAVVSGFTPLTGAPDYTNQTAVTLSGTATSGATITVYDGATDIGTAVANGASGAWTFDTASSSETALSNGAHVFAVSETLAGQTSQLSQALDVTVDTVAPTVISIDTVGASANNESAEQFTVTFSEAVTGVTAGGFSLADTGTASGAIALVTGSGSSYAVTVDDVTGNGTIKLDLNASGTGITDSADNAPSGGFISGQAYTIAQAPPIFSNVATSASYSVQAPATAVAPNLALTDAEDIDLSGATVTIGGGGFASDGDVLAAVTSGTAITASYNAATETLTLSGADTLADYQAVLRSVTFESTASDPTGGGAHLSRTLAWQATGLDGAASTIQSETIAITEVAAPGVVTSNVTLYPGATQKVASGGTASGTTVVSGSNQVVVSGGTAEGGVVSSGGGQYINSGGAASGGTVSGGAQFVEAGGTASGATVDSGAQVDYGATVSTTVNSGGTKTVEPGGTASGATVNSGGAVIVLGIANGGTVDSGGADYVEAGGTASGATISGGGVGFVETGGMASGAVVDDGAEAVYGVSVSATLNSGGYQYLEAGGTASGTIVDSGSVESVNGVASGTAVHSGGGDYLNSGGIAFATHVRGGDEFVEIGALAVGAVVDGGAEVVYGAASGTTLTSAGYQYVEAGATASGTIADATGVQVVLGTALATTDNSGGADYVYGGGGASGTQVSGGDEYVESGGAASGAHVFGGAEVVYGSATSTTLTGGFQYVESGGVASATIVDSGGYEYVAASGEANGATISGGEVELTSGATVGGTAVTFATSGGGVLRLDDSLHFGGLIAGFGQPDLLDLSDIAFGSATHVSFVEAGSNTSGTLSITDGVHTANLTLLGQYVTAQFTSAGDGHGGTEVGDPPLVATTDPGPLTLAAHQNA
jgi:autotransporter passenger strand-loop-strand repeat protein